VCKGGSTSSRKFIALFEEAEAQKTLQEVQETDKMDMPRLPQTVNVSWRMFPDIPYGTGDVTASMLHLQSGIFFGI
jgi:pyridoxal/pyridoxine/pyridoxamine kinase